MQKWEYKRLTVSLSSGETLHWVDDDSRTVLSKVKPIDLHNYLNKIGDEGWELVNVRINANGYYEFYDFKRPKP